MTDQDIEEFKKRLQPDPKLGVSVGLSPDECHLLIDALVEAHTERDYAKRQHDGLMRAHCIIADGERATAFEEAAQLAEKKYRRGPTQYEFGRFSAGQDIASQIRALAKEGK